MMVMASLGKAVFSNAALLVVKHCINLFLLIFAARELGSAQVGSISLFLSITGFFVIVGQAGVIPAIVYFKDVSTKSIVGAGFFSCAILLIFSELCLMLVCLVFDESILFKNRDLFFLLSSLIVFLRVAVVLPEGGFYRKLMFGQQSKLEILSFVLSAMAFLVLGFFVGFSLLIFVFYYVLQAGFYFIFVFLFFRKSIAKPEINYIFFVRFFRYCLWMLSAQFFNAVATNVDNFLIGKIKGAEVLGFYSRAYQLMLLPVVLVGQLIQKILFPYLRANFTKKNIRISLVLGTKITLLPCVFVGVVFSFFSNEVVEVILGDGWDRTAKLLSIFSYFLFPRCIYKVSESIISAGGQAKTLTKINSIYAILMIFCVLFSLVFYDLEIMTVGVGLVISMYSIFLFSYALKMSSMSFYEYFLRVKYDFAFLSVSLLLGLLWFVPEFILLMVYSVFFVLWSFSYIKILSNIRASMV